MMMSIHISHSVEITLIALLLMLTALYTVLRLTRQ
jgi:hypothetical protein